MTQELIPSNQNLPPEIVKIGVPSLIVQTGSRGTYKFLEYFISTLENDNTRLAYYRAVSSFLNWCEHKTITDIVKIQSVHVALYLKELQKVVSVPTRKQHLAAIRKCFDWLVISHILPINPATVVSGPKHVVDKGTTPILDGNEARTIIDGIRTDTVVGLRDRALIAIMGFTFARVSAVVGMDVEHVYVNKHRLWVKLREKGGKAHTMPLHHEAEQYLREYVDAAELWDHKKTPLFRSSFGKTKKLTENRLHRKHVHAMIRRRARDVGILSPIGCHTWRGTGITDYLSNGGSLESAQKMAAHSSPRTTKLYDRRDDNVTLDEVELVRLR